jgi:HTH-type transcriptional regulator/antitoxin HigA
MTDNLPEMLSGQRVGDELRKLGWTQADLFRILGRTRRVVSETIAGARAMTPRMAVDLEQVFGVPRREWWDLDARVVLDRLAPNPDIARLARLFCLAPIAEMIRRERLAVRQEPKEPNMPKKPFPYLERVAELDAAVCAFLGIESPDEAPPLEMEDSASASRIKPAERGWLLRARALASRMEAPDFRADEVDGFLDRLRRHCAGVYPRVRGVPDLLLQAGIRLVIVEELARTQVNGAVFGLDATRPVIALTLREDHLQRFWFWLVHELRHIKQGHASLSHPILDRGRSGGTAASDEEDAETYTTEFLAEEGLDELWWQRRNALRTSPDDPERHELLTPLHPSTREERASRRWRRELQRSARAELALEPHVIVDGWGHPAGERLPK